MSLLSEVMQFAQEELLSTQIEEAIIAKIEVSEINDNRGDTHIELLVLIGSKCRRNE